MKTLETIFATNEFVTLILVVLDDSVKLCNQLRQSGGAFISRLDVGFQLCLRALLRSNAVRQCIELFAQIFRRTVIPTGLITSTWIIRIRNQSLTWITWHAAALRIATAIPFLATTLGVRRFAVARDFGPAQTTIA